MIEIRAVSVGPHLEPDSGNEFCMITTAVVNGEVDHTFGLYSDNFNWLYKIQSHCLSDDKPYMLHEEELQDA